MKLNLEGVIANVDSQLPFQYVLDMSGVDVNGEYPFRDGVTVSGRVRNHAGVIELSVDVSFMFYTVCARCAADVEKNYFTHSDFILVDEIREDDNIDRLLIVDNSIDIDEVAHSVAILNLEPRVLCRDDCKGLCQICGANLNEGTCNCNKKEIDPRLAELKKWFD